MPYIDDLVYDIGMHKGEDTEFYLKKGYRVVAIEANPILAKTFRDRCMHEIEAGRLHIIEGAIAPPTEMGKVTFYVNDVLSVWGTISTDFVERNEKKGKTSKRIEVDRIDIGEVLRQYGTPYFMKIDIEGADGLVLDALKDLVDRPQYISFEINNVVRSNIERDIETVANLGYKKFQLVPQANIFGSRVQIKTLQGEEIEHVFARDASGAFGGDLQGEWVTRDELLAVFKRAYHGWQDIHASLS